MEFWKMNGAGNDFIVVDDRQDAIPDEKWPEIIRTVCERHMSIGADGFMVVKKPTYGGDYKMLFFNSDGSMGEMCGNGAAIRPGMASQLKDRVTSKHAVKSQKLSSGNMPLAVCPEGIPSVNHA